MARKRSRTGCTVGAIALLGIIVFMVGWIFRFVCYSLTGIDIFHSPIGDVFGAVMVVLCIAIPALYMIVRRSR